MPIRSDTKLKKHEPQTKNEKMDSVFQQINIDNAIEGDTIKIYAP